MTTHIFRYTAAGPVAAGGEVRLGPDDTHHLVRVVRRRPGDAVEVIAPDGTLWPAVVEHAGDAAVLRVAAAPRPAPGLAPVVLYQGLAEAGRLALVAEKAAELGAREVVLYTSERARRTPDADAWERRRDRLARVVEAASRQAGRAAMTGVRGLLALDAVLDEIPQGEGFLLDPRGVRTLGAALRESRPATARLLVGPDAGLSGDEVARAVSAGLVPVTLGPATLRAETAGIAAVAVAACALAGEDV